MVHEVRVVEDQYETITGRLINIAHPAFVPVLVDDLARALPVAIAILKEGLATDVGRAFDYGLAKVCFHTLENVSLKEVVAFVEKPAALYAIGFADVILSAWHRPVYPGLERYLGARNQIYDWAVNQLKMPQVPSAPTMKYVVPTMASWLEVVYLIWSGEVTREGETYRNTLDALHDEWDGERYVRACSLAWLENIRDAQPTERFIPTRFTEADLAPFRPIVR